MRLRISTRQLEDLKLIATLPEATISGIAVAAERYEGSVFHPDAVQKILKSTSELNDEQQTSVASAISGLIYAFIGSGQTEEEFLIVLHQSLKESGFSDDEAKYLEANLSRLIGVKPLFAGHKAYSLASENERIMTNCRVLTDIRPVFGQSDVNTILGYIVTHTLKVFYQDSRGEGEFFVSLDPSDLRTLEKALDRATQKAQTIKHDSGLPTFFRDEIA